MTIPFLYQLQNADYASLAKADFRVGVIDPDDSGLTAAQVRSLQDNQRKLLYAYTSIGEAEDYRAYWTAAWTTSPPKFLLSENAEWQGNYRVAFWNQDWQKIILDRIDDAIAKGYDGVYLDIVDGYTVKAVVDAYPGTRAQLRQEMIDFVSDISAHAKAVKPGFVIIPQNAVGLLSLRESDVKSGPNGAYLAAIDGLGVEDLWYDDNRRADWTSGDLEMIALAQKAGKFVLATSYPTQDAKQADFIAKATAAGLIPFVADRDLTGTVDPDNLGIEKAMTGPGTLVPWQTQDRPVPTNGNDTLHGTPSSEIIRGGDGFDKISGGGGNDRLYGGADQDVLFGGHGTDMLNGGNGSDRLFGGDGNDRLVGGSGTDGLFGGTGNDLANGDDGHDRLFGGHGNDRLKGGAGNDTLSGDAGDDHLDGGAGNDTLDGGRRHDSLYGGLGDDHMYGGADNDRPAGRDGRDVLYGGQGNDRLYGNGDADRLAGGSGDDILFGGAGADKFVFTAASNHDVIGDFDVTADVILVRGLSLVDAEELAGTLVLDFGHGTEITLRGLTLADLSDVDILQI